MYLLSSGDNANSFPTSQKEEFYFITFTCFKWLPLLEQTEIHTYFPFWVEKLCQQGLKHCGYVIMPNHIHLLVYVDSGCTNLNKTIAEGKRFMAYEIIKRLQQSGKKRLLKVLEKGVGYSERKRGKKHRVFRWSFHGKLVEGVDSINKVLDYIHYNPLSGKWNLVDDYRDSSVAFYLEEQRGEVMLWDFRTVRSASSSSDTEGG